MAKAKKLPSGSYRVLVYTGKDATGKRLYESFTADTSKEAEYAALEYQLKQKKSNKPENMTVGEAVDRYIQSKEVVLSPSTIKGYKQIRKQYLSDLMNVVFKSLTNELIQLEINKEIKSRNLSPKTLRNIVGLLSSSLKEYHPDFMLKVTLPQKERYEAHIPTIDEINKLLDSTMGTDLYIPIMLSSCLGLRRSEICALKWSDIDFKNSTIKISKAKVLNENDDWEIKNPKSYAGNRILVLPDILLYVLSDNKCTGQIVSITPTILSHRFIRFVNKLNITNFRFHDLRHPYVKLKLKYISSKNIMGNLDSNNQNIFLHPSNFSICFLTKLTAVIDVCL